MNLGFIVTSAINTKFGVFNAETRLQQTLDTVSSIYDQCPDAHVTIIEMAGQSLLPEQKAKLQEHVDIIIDFSNDSHVRAIYQNPNWDVVKNSTEIMCFNRALAVLQNCNSTKHIDRYFKVSGRYLLNFEFQHTLAAAANLNDKFIFAKRKDSQFDPKLTGNVTSQLMSRCWSFPANKIKFVETMYLAMLKCFTTISQQGGYIDIEHLLYLYAPPELVTELYVIGVEGLLGPNGVKVSD